MVPGHSVSLPMGKPENYTAIRHSCLKWHQSVFDTGNIVSDNRFFGVKTVSFSTVVTLEAIGK